MKRAKLCRGYLEVTLSVDQRDARLHARKLPRKALTY